MGRRTHLIATTTVFRDGDTVERNHIPGSTGRPAAHTERNHIPSSTDTPAVHTERYHIPSSTDTPAVHTERYHIPSSTDTPAVYTERYHIPGSTDTPAVYTEGIIPIERNDATEVINLSDILSPSPSMDYDPDFLPLTDTPTFFDSDYIL